MELSIKKMNEMSQVIFGSVILAVLEYIQMGGSQYETYLYKQAFKMRKKLYKYSPPMLAIEEAFATMVRQDISPIETLGLLLQQCKQYYPQLYLTYKYVVEKQGLLVIPILEEVQVARTKGYPLEVSDFKLEILDLQQDAEDQNYLDFGDGQVENPDDEPPYEAG